MLVAAAILLAGCTEPNPFYRDGGDTSCSPGERRCKGQTAQVCSGGETYTYINDRLCPGLSSCEGGICVPSGSICSTTCPDSQICTLFVSPTDPSALATNCAQPVGKVPGTKGCTNNQDCQSGFCLKRLSFSFCYMPCTRNRDCSSNRCFSVVMTVNGVQGKVKSCVP